MSIHFISGKPRGGKSLYSVRLVIDELVLGHRVIITNLALKLPELNAYLQAKYPHKMIDLHSRVRLLSDEEVGRFWTIRPNGVRVEMLSKEDWAKGRLPDYSKVSDGGVMYAIDEVHIKFNARAWMETGRDVLHYLSQHGKLGDTVICITQAISNVDKQFRSVAQDFTYIRNVKKEKMGLFRLPGVFVRKTYPQPATETSVAMETGTFTLDVKGIASVYDTAQGVGIHGRSADKEERVKGLSWVWVAVMVPLLLICVVKFAPNLLARVFVQPMASAQAHVASTVSPVPVVRSNAVASGIPTNQLALVKSNVITLPSLLRAMTNEPVHLCFVSMLKYGNAAVGLSNGRVYKTGDGHLQIISREYVVIDGLRYEWKN